jgi:hypothetical protein
MLKVEVASHESQTLLAGQQEPVQRRSDKRTSEKQQVAVSVQETGQGDCSKNRVPGRMPNRSAQKNLEQLGDRSAAVLAESAQEGHLAVP